jgi:hypothetical protein
MVVIRTPAEDGSRETNPQSLPLLLFNLQLAIVQTTWRPGGSRHLETFFLDLASPLGTEQDRENLSMESPAHGLGFFCDGFF